jgi:phosphohistidine phosphatase
MIDAVAQLYLVRHGEARAEGEDLQRTLTASGREEVEAMARWAGRAGVRPARIRHSGKTRARETAEILAASLGAPLLPASGMAPNDDVRAFAPGITDGDMLVGHLPFLSRLVSLLLLNDAEREVIAFSNAGMLCLIRNEGEWRVSWLVTPDIASSRTS